MGKKWSLRGIILIIIIAAVMLSTEELDDFDKNVEEHVFFAKWQSYVGCAVHEEKGRIQLPFLDEYPNYNQFAGNIKEVSLNLSYDFEDNSDFKVKKPKMPISLSGFSIIGGNKILGGKYSIRTMQIPFSIEHEGLVKFDEITIILSDGKTYTWQVGQWEIEIRDLIKYDDFEQGDRGFVIDPVPKYYFEMINTSQDTLRCDSLIYGKTILNKLQIDKSLCEPETQRGYTKMIVYCEEEWVSSEDNFYYIKPFLQYYVGHEKKLAPLKDVDFSGLFTEDALKQILKNKGTKE